MTIRELREKLFEVQDQEMTVRELRQILSEIEEQDKKLEQNEILKITWR